MGNKNTLRLVIISATLLISPYSNNNPASFARQQSRERSSFYETMYFVVNTTSPPFDNVVVRYALAMATDRQAIADAMREEGFRYLPGVGLTPPYRGYEVLTHLEVARDGRTYDVLAYNPTGARDLLAKAGFPDGVGKDKQKLTIEILVYSGKDTDKLVSIVKEQWQQNLGLEVTVVNRTWHEYLTEKDERAFRGVAVGGKSLLLADARDLLNFATGQISKKPCWVDQKFNEMLRDANKVSSSDSIRGNSKFRECEAYLLRFMPVIPLYSRAL